MKKCLATLQYNSRDSAIHPYCLVCLVRRLEKLGCDSHTLQWVAKSYPSTYELDTLHFILLCRYV
jgi:hypothetical protein